jgi:vacuolar-type H+-ATPase subunit H
MRNFFMRTQIILPEDLRNKIEKARRLTKESLAEYLRRAAKKRLDQDMEKQKDLEKLAQEVIGAAKKSSWQDVDVVEWQRKIRADRRDL